MSLSYIARPSHLKTLHFKEQRCTCGKHSKKRITGIAASNALEKKIPIFVIGKFAKPKCFRHVRNLPCRYWAPKKAWMDGTIFEELLRERDRKLEKQRRKIIMMVNKCPVHPEIKGLKSIDLQFLPPKTPSCT